MSSSNRKSASTPNNSNTTNKENNPKGNTSARSSEGEDSQSEHPNTVSPSGSGIAATRFGGNPSSSRPTGLAPGEQGTAVGPLRLEEEDMQVTGPHGRRTGMVSIESRMKVLLLCTDISDRIRASIPRIFLASTSNGLTTCILPTKRSQSLE